MRGFVYFAWGFSFVVAHKVQLRVGPGFARTLGKFLLLSLAIEKLKIENFGFLNSKV